MYILKLNEWKNTKEVIGWFASIDEKPLYKVLQFDITEFYPSIKGPLLPKALKFEEIFKNSVTPCNEALTKAGYKHQMKYQQKKS